MKSVKLSGSAGIDSFLVHSLNDSNLTLLGIFYFVLRQGSVVYSSHIALLPLQIPG